MNTIAIDSLILILLLASCSARRLESSTETCPKCDYDVSQTYEQVVSTFLKKNGPSDGVCTSGVKWILRGYIVGSSRDACCCFTVPKSAPVQCNSVSYTRIMCPNLIGIKRSESFKHYFRRIGNVMDDAPSNGCCPAGTIKWIFSKNLTQAKADICMCATPNKLLDDTEKTSFSISSSESWGTRHGNK